MTNKCIKVYRPCKQWTLHQAANCARASRCRPCGFHKLRPARSLSRWPRASFANYKQLQSRRPLPRAVLRLKLHRPWYYIQTTKSEQNPVPFQIGLRSYHPLHHRLKVVLRFKWSQVPKRTNNLGFCCSVCTHVCQQRLRICIA